jgi:hypothetical protein
MFKKGRAAVVSLYAGHLIIFVSGGAKVTALSPRTCPGTEVIKRSRSAEGTKECGGIKVADSQGGEARDGRGVAATAETRDVLLST